MRNDAEMTTTGTNNVMTRKEEDKEGGLRAEPKDTTANAGVTDGQLVDPSILQWPSESGMKVVIPLRALRMACSRGCLAALTAEEQSEIARASNETMGYVMISAKDGKITFDAGVSRLASRHVIKASEGAAARIEAEGEACVPAKEFNDLASHMPPESRIALSFTHQPPEVDKSTTWTVKILRPNGVLSVRAIKNNKIITNGQIESYPTERFASLDYPDLSVLKVVIRGKAKFIKESHGSIAFAINDIDATLNSVALFDGGDTVYFVGTDTRRCAIAKAKKSDFEKYSDFNVEENGRPIPIQIDAEYLTLILSAASDEDVVTVAMDEAGEYLYVFCGASSYRIHRCHKSFDRHYPDYRRMLSMPTGSVILVDRQECKTALKIMLNASPYHAQLMFSGNESLVRMSGRGLKAIKGVESILAYKQVSGNPLKSRTIRLDPSYFYKAIKRMTSEQVKLSFSVDETKLRVEDEVDPKFLYFVQAMNPGEG